MKLIVRTWLTACVTLVSVMAAQITSAQSVISDSDVARLRAFIGENDFEGKTPSAMGARHPSSGLGRQRRMQVQPGTRLVKCGTSGRYRCQPRCHAKSDCEEQQGGVSSRKCPLDDSRCQLTYAHGGRRYGLCRAG